MATMQTTPTNGYRRNRFYSNLKGQCLIKLPKDVSADELNVIFGLGYQSVGAAATFTFAQTAPRDLIIRDLVIDSAAGLVVTSINVSGDELLLGGPATSQSFGPQNQNRPTFDLPVSGGTQIKITVQNNTAGALLCAPAFNID
jgi:hypothetical protein